MAKLNSAQASMYERVCKKYNMYKLKTYVISQY